MARKQMRSKAECKERLENDIVLFIDAHKKEAEIRYQSLLRKADDIFFTLRDDLRGAAESILPEDLLNTNLMDFVLNGGISDEFPVKPSLSSGERSFSENLIDIASDAVVAFENLSVPVDRASVTNVAEVESRPTLPQENMACANVPSVIRPKIKELRARNFRAARGGEVSFSVDGSPIVVLPDAISDPASFAFKQAGNLFKMAKLWKEGGDAFVKAAELNGAKGDSKHDCASQYAEAANCYRKVNPQLAVDCLLKTCEIYTDMGRFNMAAKNHVTIAELYETECPDTEQCIQHYQKASDYYKGEESKSSATKCLIKVAQYAAQLEQYQKAITVFEEIAMWEADHPTLKYAAKNHFFQALLCYLCIDPLDAQHALKRYEDASPSFEDSRESKFIKDLIACLEDANEELFTDTVKAFDKISRLDEWHTRLLVKIKRAINKDDEDDLK